MIIHMSLSYLLVHFVTLLFAGSDSSFDFITFYRRASGADPGLADLLLAVEEQEEVAGQCAAEAGGKRFPFNCVLKKLLG